MTEIVVRASTAMDAHGCAGLWQEAGAYFQALNPDMFHTPSGAGLARWFSRVHDAVTEQPDRQFLVAHRDGRVSGLLLAGVQRPDEAASWQFQSDLGRRRLHIDALVVTARDRRNGIGARLLEEAERWGKVRGAEVVTLETECDNPASVPFYRKQDYVSRSLTFRKPL